VTSYTLRKGAAEKTKADVVVIGVVRTPKGLRAAPGGEGVASAYGRKFAPLLSTIGFAAKTGEVAKVPTGGRITSPLLILVGLGEEGSVDATAVRRAAGAAVRAVSNAASVAVALPAADEQHVRAVVEGSMLGGYAYTAYKTGADPQGPADVVVLTDTARTKGAKAAVETARIVSEATALARDWVNTPPGDFTPEIFADAVVAENKHRKAARVKVTVLDDQQLRDGGFGGVVGVGQGSANPPRLVQLTYSPKGATTHLALVG